MKVDYFLHENVFYIHRIVLMKMTNFSFFLQNAETSSSLRKIKSQIFTNSSVSIS